MVNDILVSSVMICKSESTEGLGVDITASNENASFLLVHFKSYLNSSE